VRTWPACAIMSNALRRMQDSRKEMSHLHALMLGPMVLATLSHGHWRGEPAEDTELNWLSATQHPQLDLQQIPAGEFSKSFTADIASVRMKYVRVAIVFPRAGYRCEAAIPVSMSVPAGAAASGTAAYVRHDKGLVHVSHIEDGGDGLDAVFTMYLSDRKASARGASKM